MTTITLTETRQVLKDGTKTVFINSEVKAEKEITEEHYNNYIESAPFFRRLGGTETLTKNYTSAGYKVVKMVSKNPDRTEKVIREFNFK